MLGSGKEIIHFMRAHEVADLGGLCRKKRLSRHFMDVMRYGAAAMTLTNGNALAGPGWRNRHSTSKIPLWLSSPVRDLIVEDGAVRGAIVERDGHLVRVNAKRGVVLGLRRVSS